MNGRKNERLQKKRNGIIENSILLLGSKEKKFSGSENFKSSIPLP